ncbi:ATP-binding cassette domain-containing protein [Soehngenia saccharolytica]|nr:ATP-binding cassette domain-containing protein [Soehngenia saccharolytica]
MLGSTRSGKSTILKLLAGLYDDYTGSIYIWQRD